eukprot:TRINITY_DN62216_c0_g1_i1.p1 TRINITY_DN62216_c0_g1~~TRINITY_DN62216_c0_g1_i1.p1  ORF type:complete len:864 (+),score=89.91 TRINITY_DN62216_c0_g1_i1:95-2593(+)
MPSSSSFVGFLGHYGLIQRRRGDGFMKAPHSVWVAEKADNLFDGSGEIQQLASWKMQSDGNISREILASLASMAELRSSDLKTCLVPQVVDAFFSEDSSRIRLLNVVFSQSASTNLAHFMQPSNEKSFLEPQRVQHLTKQLVAALDHFHKHGIVHRNLRTHNILVEGDIWLPNTGRLLMGNVDSAGRFDGMFKLEPLDQVACAKSPELLLGVTEYTPASDVWSLGRIIDRLALGSFYPDNEVKKLSGAEVYSDICWLLTIFRRLGTPQSPHPLTQLPHFFKAMPCLTPRGWGDVEPKLGASGVNLLASALCLDPSRRATTEELLRHDYFQACALPTGEPAASGSEVFDWEDLERAEGTVLEAEASLCAAALKRSRAGKRVATRLRVICGFPRKAAGTYRRVTSCRLQASEMCDKQNLLVFCREGPPPSEYDIVYYGSRSSFGPAFYIQRNTESSSEKMFVRHLDQDDDGMLDVPLDGWMVNHNMAARWPRAPMIKQISTSSLETDSSVSLPQVPSQRAAKTYLQREVSQEEYQREWRYIAALAIHCGFSRHGATKRPLCQHIWGFLRHPRCPFDDFIWRHPLNAKMRAILTDWLIEVEEKYKCKPGTVFRAMHICDRFLACGSSCPRNRYQLLGIVSLLLADRIEGQESFDQKDVVYITANAYNLQDTREMEATLTQLVLCGSVSGWTSWNFLQHFLAISPLLLRYKCLAEFILDTSLLYYHLLRHSPSLLAGAAWMIGCEVAHKSAEQMETPTWPPALEKASGRSLAAVRKCAKELWCLCKQKPYEIQLEAVQSKYSQAKHHSVATLFREVSAAHVAFEAKASAKVAKAGG